MRFGLGCLLGVAALLCNLQGLADPPEESSASDRPLPEVLANAEPRAGSTSSSPLSLAAQIENVLTTKGAKAALDHAAQNTVVVAFDACEAALGSGIGAEIRFSPAA